MNPKRLKMKKRFWQNVKAYFVNQICPTNYTLIEWPYLNIDNEDLVNTQTHLYSDKFNFKYVISDEIMTQIKRYGDKKDLVTPK